MRLFAAVWLSEELRESTGNLLKIISGDSPGVRWIPPAQLHFTLKFFGEQEPELVFRLAPYLRAAAESVSPFTLVLAGGGAFPSRRSPRVLWLGVQEGGNELAVLAGRVEEAAGKLKLPPEGKTFRPHLTIGRVRVCGNGPFAFDWRLLEEGVAGKMTVKGFSLVESRLTPQGPVYRDVDEYPLMKGHTVL